MKETFAIIFNLLHLLSVISKQQLLTHPYKFKLPPYVKLLGTIVMIIFNPRGLIIKPQNSFSERLVNGLETLGPIYIKFGQALSTRPDLVGYETATQLKFLQDKLPPFPISLAQQAIQQEFGKSSEELFQKFWEEPIAAASISQVHKAQLFSGELIVLKILRPGIYKKYQCDLKLLYFIARLSSFFLPKLKRLKPLEVVNVFNETMQSELNLRLEAAAASELSDNFLGDTTIYIPKIYWALTTENILTTEWVEGASIYNTNDIVNYGLEPKQIAAKIAIIFFNQAYRDGFFHADLHPGNILIKPDGRIALLDFGITGRLAESDRISIGESLLGFLKRDYKLVASSHLKAGYIPPNTNLNLFAQYCRTICEPIIGLPIKQISIGKLLGELFQITQKFGMETQPQLLLLQKTMVMVEGIGQTLDPEINMWELATPWIKKWAVKNLSFEAKLLRQAKKMASNLLDIY